MAEPSDSETNEESRIARETWARYESARLRGHTDYQRTAKRNEEIYLGGGLQWTPEDRAILDDEGRPAYEVNVVKVAVDAAIGYQINNRLDIAFAPRGGEADDKTAEILNRVVMQIADNINLDWAETQVFSDGMIEQRGFFDVRLEFDENMQGEANVRALDPLDVIPDPDGKDYDPDTWYDVTTTAWLTLDEIEQGYGNAARRRIERNGDPGEDDFGENEMDGVPRSKFGYEAYGEYSDHILDRPSEGPTRVRVIERQRRVYTMVRVAVTAEGDVRDIEEMESAEVEELRQSGAIITRRMKHRIRWTVCTADTVLHDDWSPYPWFTIVPYFPYFRRGQTRGLVDNAISPQEIINKAISQYIHVANSSANSGWTVEEGSLKNMSTDELQVHGSSTGLVIEYKQGRQAPEKITPNQVPNGIDRIIDRAFDALKEVTVPDAMRGLDNETQDSGVAIQSRQFAAQQQLAVALDNLARTRNLVARRLLWIIQNFYDEERVFRITETRPSTGKEVSYDLPVNVQNPITGNVVNDLTVGKYDVVISEQPMQVTFGNSQFEQALKMREMGVRIPDAALIRTSMLTNKTELLEQMQQQAENADPVSEAEAKLKLAQAAKAEADAAKAKAETRKSENEAVGSSVEAQYSAIQTAQTIAQLPQTAPLADSILKSAGFEDQDAAPIVPSYQGQPARSVPGKYVVATDGQGEGMQGDTNGDGVINGGDIAGVPENTNPLTPTNPDRGMNAGIEGGDEPAQ